jgi:hypothetical protein
MPEEYIIDLQSSEPRYFPQYVSVAATGTESSSSDSIIISNLLLINYPGSNTKPNFAICVQPIFDYDDAIRFLEWVEFYRALGVERFSFYNISIGPQVSCLMEQYRRFGEIEGLFMEVRPWGDPPSDKIRMGLTLKAENQLAALNDCLFREVGRSRYVFHTDLDEFVVPHEKGIRSYFELIRRLDEMALKEGGGRAVVGVYQIPNVFFDPEFSRIGDENKNNSKGLELADDGDELLLATEISSQLVTLKYSVRHTKAYPKHYR